MYRQLIPTVVDQIAETEPETTWAVVSVLPTGNDAGYQNITYRQFANAINSIAWWLEGELGRGDMTEPFVYFGTGGSDVRYVMLLIAAVKAGYYTLLNSPRNSVDAHVSLFKSQNCHTMIVPEPRPPYVASLLAAYPMRVLQLPNLEGLLNGETLHYPIDRNAGFPKPRTISLGCAAAMANVYDPPSINGLRPATTLGLDQLLFSTFPMFHAAGVVINIIGVVYCRQKIAFPPLQGPPMSAEAILSLIEVTHATAAAVPPSIVSDISKSPNLLNILDAMKLKYIVFGGGTMPKAAGDVVIEKTMLVNLYGSTELGPLRTISTERKDWAYLHPSIDAGVDFRHVSGDGYEMVVVRDERLEGMQPTFEVFPDLQEYPTSDIFSKHPTKVDHWLYQGRSDDVIVFLNGEKTNPILMEDLVQSHPDVLSALVIGQDRFEAALLIEPSQPSKLSTSAKAELIERLWPVVEEANRKCPAYARVSKSHILFTSPEKPMSRAAKGTVQRKHTIDKFSSEIEALYVDAETINDHDAPVKVDPLAIKQSVHQIVAYTTGLDDLGAEEDLFSRGMDSLQVIQIARYLKSGLQGAGMKVGDLGPSTIYTNPTITKLTSIVESFDQQVQATRESAEKARIDNMREMLEKYSKTSNSKVRKEPLETVVLTGSTGALGSYLLEAFSKSEVVSKIYCLNRSTNSKQRQALSSASRGLASQWSPERVIFLTSDFSKDDLGLDQKMFSEIQNRATVIVHNAWQVNFNLSLESYEHGQISGVRNLIDFAAQSVHRAKIFFISSIASVMEWPNHHTGPVPEEIIDDFTVPQHMGYGESKHISERLLGLGSANFNLPISICRVGQVAGPVRSTQGMWNKQEWFPSLVLSSKHLGVIPDTLGTLKDIDWIPIDLLSSIISELALKPSSPDALARVFHTVNPSITTWTTLLPHVQAELGAEVAVVPFATWLKKLRASSASSTSAQDFTVNPALKLLDFYEGLSLAESTPARLDTVKTERECDLLTEVGPVTGDWMSKWIRQWGV
ncbi:hypothetical protein MMC07_001640 [Pseudocyphellaria aurata]|nr:hypothetical protein [Pseudocyphellaria aurata]